MSESSPAPNASLEPHPAEDAAVGLGGVSAQATAGSVAAGPQPDAAPAAQQPASTPTPTGAAPDEKAATVATPGAGEEWRTVAVVPASPEDAERLRNAQAADAWMDVGPQVKANLNAIEQTALFWGGETGIKIRNHVGRLRQLLGLI